MFGSAARAAGCEEIPQQIPRNRAVAKRNRERIAFKIIQHLQNQHLVFQIASTGVSILRALVGDERDWLTFAIQALRN